MELKLEDIWERQKPTIEDGLRADGLSIEIALYRDEGGGSGNYTKYGFRIDVRADSGDSAPDIDLLRVPQLQYRHQDISGNRLVRWMSDRGLYLGGWGGEVFLSVFFLLLIFTVVWSWLVHKAAKKTLSRWRARANARPPTVPPPWAWVQWM